MIAALTIANHGSGAVHDFIGKFGAAVAIPDYGNRAAGRCGYSRVSASVHHLSVRCQAAQAESAVHKRQFEILRTASWAQGIVAVSLGFSSARIRTAFNF